VLKLGVLRLNVKVRNVSNKMFSKGQVKRLSKQFWKSRKNV